MFSFFTRRHSTMRNFTLALQKVGRRRTPKMVHPLALRQQLYSHQLDNIHFLRTVTFLNTSLGLMFYVFYFHLKVFSLPEAMTRSRADDISRPPCCLNNRSAYTLQTLRSRRAKLAVVYTVPVYVTCGKNSHLNDPRLR